MCTHNHLIFLQHKTKCNYHQMNVPLSNSVKCLRKCLRAASKLACEIGIIISIQNINPIMRYFVLFPQQTFQTTEMNHSSSSILVVINAANIRTTLENSNWNVSPSHIAHCNCRHIVFYPLIGKQITENAYNFLIVQLLCVNVARDIQDQQSSNEIASCHRSFSSISVLFIISAKQANY